MHLPSHITARKKDIQKSKENRKSDREKHKSNRPDGAEKKSDKTQASTQPKTDELKSDRKEPNTNTSNPAYPGNKKKNSDGYGGYGYKKSANSTASNTKSSHIAMTDELKREDKMNTREADRKQLGSTILMLLVGLAILITFNSVARKKDEKINLKFDITSASTTHYKLSVLTNDIHVSRLLRDLSEGRHQMHQSSRKAAYLFTFFAKYVFEKAPDGLLVNASLGNCISLLSWGFDQKVNEMNPGPIIANSEKVVENKYERAMTFSDLSNTSSMSQFLDKDAFVINLMDRQGDDNFSKNLSQIANSRESKTGVILDEYFLAFYSGTAEFTLSNPTIPLSNLTTYDTDEYGFLQFASSGPKTLGTIAEIAIQMSLETLVCHDSMSDIDYVDKVIAQALIHTLDAVASQTEYFEKLVLNKTIVMEEVREKLQDPENKNLEKHHRSSSIVKFETSGALTTTLLILDNRDGWPSVFHYSVSAPGPFVLQALGKNSSEMVNSCQVIVIKDGYLWLTAAASGEFYLLEKVVASIVHKIVRNVDPLAEIVYRSRLRYDTRKREIVTDEKADAPYPKESLQFSEYNILKDRFRSWNQRSSNSTSHKFRKWNIATGF